MKFLVRYRITEVGTFVVFAPRPEESLVVNAPDRDGAIQHARCVATGYNPNDPESMRWWQEDGDKPWRKGGGTPATFDLISCEEI